MKKVLKWSGLGLAGVIGLAALTVGVFALRVELKRGERALVEPSPLEIPTDSASITEGRRLTQTKGCFDCHGTDLGGKTFVNEAPIGVYSGTNLTKGRGGVGDRYTDTDWVRAIRHGVGPDGRMLVFMPSAEFYFLSDPDLAKIVAYLKTVPSVDRELPPIQIGPVARVLYHLDQFPLLFSAELIRDIPRPTEVLSPAPTAQYGQYLAQGCVGCHGPQFKGGKIPGVPPSWPAASDLTPSGPLARYSLAQFGATLRTGVKPSGEKIDPQFMPWAAFAAMNDVEVEALYRYFTSLPRENNEISMAGASGLQVTKD